MPLLVGLVASDAIYVSASGNDAGSGAASQPLASIQRAVDLSRSSGRKRIVLDGGEYDLRASISLDKRDDGLTIEAKRGTRPLITGSVIVPQIQIGVSHDQELQNRATTLDPRAQAYVIDVKSMPGVTISPYSPYGFPRPVIPGPTELFENANPMTIARWPNVGFTKIKSVREPGNGEGDRDKPLRRPVFTAITDRAKSWKSIENAWLFGYWKFDWADETIKLHSVDLQTGEITLETPHTFGVAADSPFRVENLPEELDAIGEYYADPGNGTVQFVTERGKTATYRLSELGEPLITLNDSENVSVRGLDFGYSRGNGAVVNRCIEARFEGCQFFNLGERAAEINNGHDCGLMGCNIWNTGEGGVVLTGGDRNTLTPAHLYVVNCDIHDYERRSQTYRPGVSINGVGNVVAHCAIHNAPHSAIIFGGNNHVIEFNEFYKTIARTGDGGVVYTGRDWTARGTDIRYNYFHDNVGLSKWEPAIYFDDLASGLKATGNIIERCHWGFLIGGGRDNIIADNKIIDCKLGMQCDARGLGWAKTSKPTMMERLNAVPYLSQVWKEAYPSLSTILDSDSMAPSGNVVKDNVLVRSGKLKQQTEAAFDKTTQWVNNTEVEAASRPPSSRGWGLVNDRIRATLPKV